MNPELFNTIMEMRLDHQFSRARKELGDEKISGLFRRILAKFSVEETAKITCIPASTLEYWLRELDIDIHDHKEPALIMMSTIQKTPATKHPRRENHE